MIEINELRIWNTVSIGVWVNKWVSVPYQIMGFQVNKAPNFNKVKVETQWNVEVVSCSHFGVTKVKLSELYPIHLDHDIFLNLGFTFNEQESRYYKDRFFIRKKSNRKTGEVHYRLPRGGIFNDKIVLSVHELQNIYYALYNIELIYNYQSV